MKYFETLQMARDHRKNSTMAEKVFWGKVRNKKFHGLKFNREFLLEYKETMGNKLYYIADFHNFENKLIIEIDGEIHKEQAEYDKERTKDIEFLGYTVIRFSNEEVLHNWDLVEKKLLEFLPIPGSSPTGA